MKEYKDLTIGDEVYVQTAVEYSFRSHKYFTIKENIIKLTKTQFTVSSGRRFKRDSGTEIGYYGGAKLKGVDQSKEMNEFKYKLSKINRIHSQSYKIDLPINTDIKDIEKIEYHLKSINKIIRDNSTILNK